MLKEKDCQPNLYIQQNYSSEIKEKLRHSQININGQSLSLAEIDKLIPKFMKKNVKDPEQLKQSHPWRYTWK